MAWLFGFVATSRGACTGGGAEYMVCHAIPGVVDAGEKQQQHRASDAE